MYLYYHLGESHFTVALEGCDPPVCNFSFVEQVILYCFFNHLCLAAYHV